MTQSAQPAPPVKARHHLASAISLGTLRSDLKKVDGLNAKLALFVTNVVGSMWCAYVFCVIALASLPAILVQAGVLRQSQVPSFLTKPGLILIVAWVAQTFIQLVLLSVIMVGQSVQSAASDARAAATYDDTVAILDALNVQTPGGLHVVLDRVEQLVGHPAIQALFTQPPSPKGTTMGILSDINSEIDHVFGYHPNSTDLVAQAHEKVRTLFADAAKELVSITGAVVPQAKEIEVALQKLDEAAMWAHAHIARNQTAAPPAVAPAADEPVPAAPAPVAPVATDPVPATVAPAADPVPAPAPVAEPAAPAPVDPAPVPAAAPTSPADVAAAPATPTA